MSNKTLFIFIGFDILFLLCAILHLFIPLFTRTSIQQPPTVENVARNLLLDECPLTASMVNSGIMFAAFLISFPAFFLKSNRLLLNIHACLLVVCALFTLGIGLEIWYSTLQTRANLEPIWNKQSSYVQSMLQFKFQCCGYRDVQVFVQDGTCKNVAEAARHDSCMGPFSVFANEFLDIVFTCFFGFCAVDMMVLLSVLCLLKDRKEKARYKLIDEKRGSGGI